jgi:hypothetical protein
LGCGRVASSVQNLPHQGDSDTAVYNGEHQNVDVMPTKLPTCSVKGEKPRPPTYSGDPDNETGELAAIQNNLLKEPLQPAIVRRNLRLCREGAGKVTEVDGA